MYKREIYNEPELAVPVNLCLPDGKLNPAAVGWSRQPLHNCNLNGAFLRKKRWNYWCITTLISNPAVDFFKPGGIKCFIKPPSDY